MPSPARLFAPHPTCVACLRYYHTAARLQRHLKGSRRCLQRACQLLPPLALTSIAEVEASDTKQDNGTLSLRPHRHFLRQGPHSLRELNSGVSFLSTRLSPCSAIRRSTSRCSAGPWMRPATTLLSPQGLRPLPFGTVGSARSYLTAFCRRPQAVQPLKTGGKKRLPSFGIHCMIFGTRL